MSRSSARNATAPGWRGLSSFRSPSGQQPLRGQVEPIPALTAVVIIGLALSLYATSLPTAAFANAEHDVAQPTLSRVFIAVTDDGVVHESLLTEAANAGPAGYDVNVTLTFGNQRLQQGPNSPDDASRATRQVSVRRANGTVVPGRLTVEVWS